MHEILKKIYRAIIKRLPTKIVLNIENLRGYKRLLKKNRIEYFGEKIQWMKMYGGLEKYSNLVDKYVVREYVKNKVGEKYLTNIIKVYDSTSEIDFDKLPEKFVLKLNTGSGYNIICKDKEKLNREKTIKQLNKWLKEDYTKIKKEPQYKDINKKIICEEYMESKDGNLFDYKLFCFKGKVEFIEVDFDRFENHAMNFYNRNWNLLDLKKGKYPNYSTKLKKPANLSEMIKIAEKLSTKLPFARIDLYDVDDKIYFGEITLTPAGGLTPFTPLSKDLEIAKMIDLDKYKRNNILLIARTSEKRKVLDGVTVKAKVLKEYLESIEQLNVKTIDVDNWKKTFPKIILQILKNYKKTDKIVICSSSHGASVILKFLKLVKCKKGVYYFVSGGNLVEKIKEEKYKIDLYTDLTRIYVESKDMLKQFRKIGLNNVEQINNFRKVDKFHSLYKKSKTIKCVFYGRIVKEKGIEEAIKIVKRLVKENYNISLDIYGQVNEKYLETINKLFIPEIKYCGVIQTNNKIEYEILSQYDIFLFPTEHNGEGLPGALIDAYIAGLAVIASEWKYSREYIENGKNGLIFKYKDYNDFYEKLKQIVKDDNILEYKKYSQILSQKYLVNNVLEKVKEELQYIK